MKPRTWFAVASFTVATLVLTTTGLAQTQTIPRELAQRLAGAGATILVGELPSEKRLGFDFPLTQRTRVVGANVWADPSYSNVSLYLSSGQPVADVKTFYHQAFRDLGWRLGQTYQQIGFLPSGASEAVDSMTFCRSQGERGTDVYLTLGTQQQATLIDAHVNTYDRSQGSGACDEQEPREPPIPALDAPVESQTITLENLSGFDQGNGGAVIVLKTPLNARDLLEHYAQQLELSGWQEDATAESGAARFVTYRFRNRGEAFIGTLQVVSLAQEGRYLAQVTVVNP